MDTIRYIHAADLHLDAPFAGIAQNVDSGLGRALKDAAFRALENLAAVCENEKPDFLVLAGDIYNQEERSIRAQLRVRDLCARLDQLNMPVFICHGNHDPWSSRLNAIAWPKNVTIFGPEPTFATVEKNGETLALVHGASHAAVPENRNLAQLFHRDAACDCFQLGVLHCNVDGSVAGDRYSPCSLADLKASGLDAWALGHAHERKILCEDPFIAYSGSIQGLRSSETGPKGAFLVTGSRRDGRWQCEARFLELAPLEWQNARVNLDNVSHLDSVEELIQEAMDNSAAGTTGCEGVILGLDLEGRTILDDLLRKNDVADELAERAAASAERHPPVWLRQIRAMTRPEAAEADNPDRDDLPGEIIRLAQRLENDGAALKNLCEKALAPLYGNRRFRALLKESGNEENGQLLEKARKICIDVLEGR